METLILIICCLAIAIIGAWEVSKARHQIGGKLPEDIQ